jgi:hypothetical protein
MYFLRAHSFHPGWPGFGSCVVSGEPSVDVDPARTLRIRSRWFNASSVECITDIVSSIDAVRNASEFVFRTDEEVSALTDRTIAEIANKVSKAIKAKTMAALYILELHCG